MKHFKINYRSFWSHEENSTGGFSCCLNTDHLSKWVTKQIIYSHFHCIHVKCYTTCSIGSRPRVIRGSPLINITCIHDGNIWCFFVLFFCFGLFDTLKHTNTAFMYLFGICACRSVNPYMGKITGKIRRIHYNVIQFIKKRIRAIDEKIGGVCYFCFFRILRNKSQNYDIDLKIQIFFSSELILILFHKFRITTTTKQLRSYSGAFRPP